MKKLVMLISATLFLMILCQYDLKADKSDLDRFSFHLRPKVSLDISGSVKKSTWGQQLRYSIEVEDPVDGYSKYNEINPKKVFLSIKFVPGAGDSSDLINENQVPSLSNSEGLALMGKGGCFGCHGDKTNKIGPSFDDIAKSVEFKNSSVFALKKSIRNGSAGKWGDKEMPPNPDYSQKEAGKIVEFLLKQGRCKKCWIYPGLEGAFQITEKPNGVDAGLYLLTASYTSSNGKYGKDSILLKVR